MKERVVEDRNRIPAGGIPAGIALDLTLAGKPRGQDAAKRIERRLEYDPKPPFAAGTPNQAQPALKGDGLRGPSALIRKAEHAARGRQEQGSQSETDMTPIAYRIGSSRSDKTVTATTRPLSGVDIAAFFSGLSACPR